MPPVIRCFHGGTAGPGLSGVKGEMTMKLLVSRCLLGEPCRYDGQSKPLARLDELLRAGHELVPVCPETLGGLPTPRPPAELQPDGRVCCADGRDVTAAYRLGAEKTLELARSEGCQAALLKENSPSCGFGTVYSGDFSHTLISGSGTAARLLAEHGVPVLGESRLDDLL